MAERATGGHCLPAAHDGQQLNIRPSEVHPDGFCAEGSRLSSSLVPVHVYLFTFEKMPAGLSFLAICKMAEAGCWLQNARARWNSLDSLFVFSWSGSAAFGGFMIAKWGFGAAFLITAILQLV